VATGVRVPLNTHAPLRLPGMLSTAGHCDQSRVAILLHRSFLPQLGGATRGEGRKALGSPALMSQLTVFET